MRKIKATTCRQAQELLHSGGEVELAFSISADEFFELASEWCSKGAKIKRVDEFFTVSMKKLRIPPNDSSY
ncbi:hypothetical protein [Yersinia intermedia]|uniref:hypothetical protein n=1 Tax=Yersinia intermedia TaxID=631 RepID=UPI000B706C2E|nr:hypothetical protein [Yersinia intermedia]MCW8114089.1 hypothetical protein [Yersinia intermedia]MDA5518861.1 hypothetical protein [Yersinia intermedia]OWF87283.1 hypothetical protein B4916_21770 [Yersinia intermedia]